MLAQNSRDLQIAYDVGHSSLGWSVIQTAGTASFLGLDVIGCGAVIFRPDDCLASKRRAFRRQRRHIRSTRQRIARLKRLLGHLGMLTPLQLNGVATSSPWHLAARVLAGGSPLSWPELWDALRWYAHNRGYDGNRRWSAAEASAQAEDIEKVETARTLMAKHGASSMAETFCRELQVDPLGKKGSSTLRFKGLAAAFPREIVEQEVRALLEGHAGVLPHVDEALAQTLLADWTKLPCPGLKLPRRFQGGLLFGQLVPRFDNRIIARCPVSGEKVPTRDCVEFYRFRWAMQLANIRVAAPSQPDLQPLTVEQRLALDARMRQTGAFTAGELTKAVRELTGGARDNLETMLMHPDAKDALLLDPVQKLVTSGVLKNIWPLLTEPVRKRARGRLRRFKLLTLGELIVGSPEAAAAAQRALDAENTKKRRKDKGLSLDAFLAEPFGLKPQGQRAAYARPILQQAYQEVMAGLHPKGPGGCLFVTEQMRLAQTQRALDEQTNNHLVRHRLLLLERLQRDILKEYADGDPGRVARVTIEVNPDLRTMSGMTNKEKAQDLGQQLANFKHVARKLEEQGITARPGIIRKARIAEDLAWTCPYTGQIYDVHKLLHRAVDKDHIIPRSERPSDSLDSQVITFAEINRWKGNRTAMQFIEQEQGKTVPGLPQLTIWSAARYREFIDKLETYKGHSDDQRRKRKRKGLLLLHEYAEKEFVPSDLTQTSQLVRLGAQMLQRAYAACETKPVFTSMPGSVTGSVRRSWDLLGCLEAANPNVLDEQGALRTKTEIRDISHLHHALDACTIALASHYLPRDGGVWELIVKRRLSDPEKAQLRAATGGLFNFNADGRFGLLDLPDSLKQQIRLRLAERRVVQHLPAKIRGLRVEQNTWSVVKVEDGVATLRQRMRAPDGSRPTKETRENVQKLLGLTPENGPGKLAALKGALVIPDNFGVALDPAPPTIIPFHKVWSRLQRLTRANGGKRPRVIRNGQIIVVPRGTYAGTWRVFSVKNNKDGVALNMGYPDVVRLLNKTPGHKINARLATLLNDGLQIPQAPLTGTFKEDQPLRRRPV